MTIFRTIRDRVQARRAGEGPPAAGLSQDLTDRYAGLSERQAVAGLHQFSQVELTAIQAFERTHRHREPVLDKVRSLKQREPLPDYDALEPGAVAQALSDADDETVKTVHEYERKHQNRPAVNAAIVEAMRQSRERPAASADGSAAGSEQPTERRNGLPIKVEPESGLGTP